MHLRRPECVPYQNGGHATFSGAWTVCLGMACYYRIGLEKNGMHFYLMQFANRQRLAHMVDIFIFMRIG